MNAPVVHIVDDDASVLASVSRLLRASGFAVRTFVAEFPATREGRCAGLCPR